MVPYKRFVVKIKMIKERFGMKSMWMREKRREVVSMARGPEKVLLRFFAISFCMKPL